MAEVPVWVPIAAALGGVVLGNALALVTALVTESRRERATTARDLRERRVRELLEFHEAAEALIRGIERGVQAMWSDPSPSWAATLAADVGDLLSTAQVRVQRVRDEALDQRLDALNKVLTDCTFEFLKKHEDAVQGLTPPERFMRYVESGDGRRVADAGKAIRSRVRELRDELEPIT